jgi:hypothetical protein
MADDYKDVITEQYPQALAEEKTLGRVTLFAMALALFGMFPLRGLPGLLIFDLFVNILISILPGSHTWCRFSSDALLPLTLCITFLWPISLPVGYAIAFNRFRAYPKSAQVLIWLAITVLWGALLSVGLCLAGARASVSMTCLEQVWST